MLASHIRQLQNRRRIYLGLFGPATVEWIPPDSVDPVVGTTISGTFPLVQDCTNGAYWVIEETASGIDVRFTFNVPGKSRHVRVKGRWAGALGETLAIQAWNGLTWDDIDFIPEEVVDKTYTISLLDTHTIDGVTKVRVYRGAGVDDKLYLDCISVLSTVPPPTDATDCGADGDSLLMETGDYLLQESGCKIFLE
jgi:hypothetical protein